MKKGVDWWSSSTSGSIAMKVKMHTSILESSPHKACIGISIALASYQWLTSAVKERKGLEETSFV